MKVIAILGLCLVVAHAIPTEEINSEWELYKKVHGKTYDAEEESRRINIFLENKQKISEHNKKFVDGSVSFRVDVNRFTDMLESEVAAIMNGGLKVPMNKTGEPYVDDGSKADATVDWRTKGVVTPVKDQGQCGSCWAFAATGSLEGQHALKARKLVSLSDQNLVDCCVENYGCDGGWPNTGFNYIQKNGGIDTEASYPYTARDGKCRFRKANVGATVSGHVDIPQGNENALKSAVSTIGPISVCIDASNWSFQQYSRGVYNEPNCSSQSLDHCVLIVGYGTENGKDYWLVKNSWGASWGEAGYIKMSRNANNQCGIATAASYPTV